MRKGVGMLAVATLLLLATGTLAWSQSRPLAWGVIIWRSPTLTAQFWNPILRYVAERSGVPLRLKVAPTGPGTHDDGEARRATLPLLQPQLHQGE
jgi:phosphonate transport system substrate-binding protein